MRLPTRVHGVLDYVVAVLLIALPFLLHLRGGPACWVLIGAGVAVIAYSLLTDYELGVWRRLQMPVHLWIDGLLGVLLAVSPWLFGFDTEVWKPHVLLGVVSIAAALLTDTIPGYERRQRG
jgi:hypothetical protein